MTLRRWMAVAVVMAGALAVGCKGGGVKEARAAEDAAATALPVSVVEAAGEDVQRRVDLTGTLAPWEEAVISFEADGRLAEVKVDLGDAVKKGQVLARLNPLELASRRAQAEAELAAATADFGRVSQLAGKDMATKQQADEAKRRLDVARTGADIARKKLEDAVLKAPFEGVVARRMVNAGEYVRIGTPAFQVVSVSPLKFKGDVPERFQPDVKVDDPVEARNEALGSTVLKGSVARIGPAVSADTRSFPIEARIDNPDGAVKPGTFARVSLLTATTTQSVTIPDNAVVMFAGNPRVFVVEGDRARERPVELGDRFASRVVVTRGLKAGEKVVVTGLERVTDGTPVAVRAAAQEDAR